MMDHLYIKGIITSYKFKKKLTFLVALQGPKLQPAGRQCDWKVSVGNQNFEASRH